MFLNTGLKQHVSLLLSVLHLGVETYLALLANSFSRRGANFSSIENYHVENPRRIVRDETDCDAHNQYYVTIEGMAISVSFGCQIDHSTKDKTETGANTQRQST